MPDQPPTEFRAVVFDLDGTLLDTLRDIGRSANDALAALGFPPHPIDAYRQFIGEGIGTLFRRALPADAQDEAIVTRCVDGFRETYGRGWNVETRPYDGIPELLDALAARALGLAVLSNKPDAFARQCVDEFLGRWPFRFVFGDRAGVPRKPDPAGALAIAEGLGVAPGAVLYVGDSSIDMATARGAGMVPIGVAWGFRSADELRAHGAARIIEGPLELLDILEDGGWT